MALVDPNAKPFWKKSGDKPLFPDPLIGEYSTGTEPETMGNASELNPHNNDRASRIPNREPEKTAFHRSAMSQTEADGARLSISPSMKIPSNDPAAGTLGSSLRVVKSGGRRQSFDSGQQIGY